MEGSEVANNESRSKSQRATGDQRPRNNVWEKEPIESKRSKKSGPKQKKGGRNSVEDWLQLCFPKDVLPNIKMGVPVILSGPFVEYLNIEYLRFGFFVLFYCKLKKQTWEPKHLELQLFF